MSIVEEPCINKDDRILYNLNGDISRVIKGCGSNQKFSVYCYSTGYILCKDCHRLECNQVMLCTA